MWTGPKYCLTFIIPSENNQWSHGDQYYLLEAISTTYSRRPVLLTQAATQYWASAGSFHQTPKCPSEWILRVSNLEVMKQNRGQSQLAFLICLFVCHHWVRNINVKTTGMEFLENVNVTTQIVLSLILFYNKGLQLGQFILLHTKHIKKESVANERNLALYI